MKFRNAFKVMTLSNIRGLNAFGNEGGQMYHTLRTFWRAKGQLYHDSQILAGSRAMVIGGNASDGDYTIRTPSGCLLALRPESDQCHHSQIYTSRS